jgi:class 3 adenylate cyclase
MHVLLQTVLAQEHSDTVIFDQAKLRHDFRTPINAIKGYGEMIVEDARDAGHDSLLPDLEKLLTAADGMLERIDALVAFSGEAQTGRAEPSFGDASRVLDALRIAQPAVAQHTIAGQILVIDDNASNRDLLARQLARDGHAVETVGSGAEGLALAAGRGFDLILLDVLMPEMTGYEVLSRLKHDPHLADIPVIMISALDEMDSIVRCIEAGAIDYLPKPFAPALLRARIRASLENKLLRDRERAMMAEIRLAKERNEALLLSILPRAVVERINDGAAMVADHIPEATIVFADIVNFTPFSGNLSASDVVGVLNRIFSAFDRLVDHHRAEKIKTIGDGYMVAVGIPEPCDDHAAIAARLSLAMLDNFAAIRSEIDAPIQLRVGMHIGPAIAGVIGERKFAYDIWGTTVNIASRMESHGAPDRVHVSKIVADRLAGQFRCIPRGAVEVKGARLMETFWLEAELNP